MAQTDGDMQEHWGVHAIAGVSLFFALIVLV